MRWLITSAALVILLTMQTPNATAETLVPFVGCPGESMTGYSGPFDGDAVPVNISQSLAAHLAFYAGDQTDVKIGVLAPRGWYCASNISSGHFMLVVVPYKISPFSDSAKKDAPSVLLRMSFNGTSGRFDVADTVKTYFPKLDSYVSDTLDEEKQSPGGNEAAPRPGSGIPYPNNSLSYLDDDTLAFVTRWHSIGVGAWSKDETSSFATYGLLHVYLPDQYDGYVVTFTVRLPRRSMFLEPALLQDEQQRLKLMDAR